MKQALSPMPHQYKRYCENVEKKSSIIFSKKLIFIFFYSLGEKTALNQGMCTFSAVVNGTKPGTALIETALTGEFLY